MIAKDNEMKPFHQDETRRHTQLSYFKLLEDGLRIFMYYYVLLLFIFIQAVNTMLTYCHLYKLV